MKPLRQVVQKGIAQGGEAFVAATEDMFGPESAERKRRLLAADLEAYLALTQDRPSLADILRTMPIPCCLYAGEIDSVYSEVKQCSRHMRGATFFSLPGLGHCEAFARSELVLPCITKFLNTANPS